MNYNYFPRLMGYKALLGTKNMIGPEEKFLYDYSDSEEENTLTFQEYFKRGTKDVRIQHQGWIDFAYTATHILQAIVLIAGIVILTQISPILLAISAAWAIVKLYQSSEKPQKFLEGFKTKVKK